MGKHLKCFKQPAWRLNCGFGPRGLIKCGLPQQLHCPALWRSACCHGDTTHRSRELEEHSQTKRQWEWDFIHFNRVENRLFWPQIHVLASDRRLHKVNRVMPHDHCVFMIYLRKCSSCILNWDRTTCRFKSELILWMTEKLHSDRFREFEKTAVIGIVLWHRSVFGWNLHTRLLLMVIDVCEVRGAGGIAAMITDTVTIVTALQNSVWRLCILAGVNLVVYFMVIIRLDLLSEQIAPNHRYLD